MNLSKVIVSLTTIPSRSQLIRPTVKSLLAQTCRPHQIIVSLAQTKKNDYHPSLVSLVDAHRDVVQIVWLDDDYGPVCKLLGALKYFQQEDEKEEKDQVMKKKIITQKKIITVDDDVVYYPNMIEDLLMYDAWQQAEHKPVAAIGFGGAQLSRLPPFMHVQMTTSEPSPGQKLLQFGERFPQRSVDWLMGTAGVLYDTRFFQPDAAQELIELSKDPRMRRADDVTISGYLSRQGIDRLLVFPIQRFEKVTTMSQDQKMNSTALSGNLFRAAYNHVFTFMTLQKRYKCFESSATTNYQPSIATSWIVMVIIVAVVILFMCYRLIQKGRNILFSTNGKSDAAMPEVVDRSAFVEPIVFDRQQPLVDEHY